MESDTSFDDAWWDSLAIDPATETQLHAVEQQSTQAHTLVPSQTKPDPETDAALQVELVELRALRRQQEQTIDDLRRRNQAQSGEIAVVRGNWNRARLENSELRQAQSDLEVDYRKRLEKVHQDNQRQFEKLETASAFRVRAC